MGKHPERRKYKRIKKNFILYYYSTDRPEIRYDASQVKNISLGGMCLITSKPFEPGSPMTIEFKTPFQTDFTQMDGVVQESHEKIKNLIYETRLKFLDLHPQVIQILNKIIKHFEKEESQTNE